MSSYNRNGRRAAKRQKSRHKGYILDVPTSLSCYVFNDKAITLKVFVRELATNCTASNLEVRVTGELLVQDGGEWLPVEDRDIFSCNSPDTKLGKSFCSLTFNGKKSLSMNNGNRPFKIRLSGTSESALIESCLTKEFKVVNSIVEITEHPDDVFYKDFGGQKACLKSIYKIRDRSGDVTSRLPCKIVPRLYFEDGTPVPDIVKKDKPIFKVLEHKPCKGRPGHAIIKWRVNDVSRSYGLKKFMLRLEPDPRNPDSFATAHADTIATEVMSKRKNIVGKGMASKVLGKRKQCQNGGIQQAAVLHQIDEWGRRLMVQQRQFHDQQMTVLQRLLRNQDRQMHHHSVPDAEGPDSPLGPAPQLISTPEGTPPPLMHSLPSPVYHIAPNHPMLREASPSERYAAKREAGFRHMYDRVPPPPNCIQKGRIVRQRSIPVSPPSGNNQFRANMVTLPIADKDMSFAISPDFMPPMVQLNMNYCVQASGMQSPHISIKAEAKSPTGSPELAGDLRRVSLRHCRSNGRSSVPPVQVKDS